MISDDVRSTMLKYLDDARQSKEVIARHPATAKHKARAESEIARLTTAIEWSLHQSSQRALVPSTELDAARQRIAALEAEVERLRAASQVPHPDWTKAPEWAQWWAVDARGISWWYQHQPAPVETEWYVAQSYLAQSQAGERIYLQLGIDWRTTLQQRPLEFRK